MFERKLFVAFRTDAQDVAFGEAVMRAGVAGGGSLGEGIKNKFLIILHSLLGEQREVCQFDCGVEVASFAFLFELGGIGRERFGDQ